MRSFHKQCVSSSGNCKEKKKAKKKVAKNLSSEDVEGEPAVVVR